MGGGEGRKIVDGLQEIGFPLGIIALEKGNLRPKGEGDFLVITEIPEPKPS
jgi:hypothetical protein